MAKRVNTRFLIGLSICFAVVAALFMGLLLVGPLRHDSQFYLRQARKAEESGDLQEAIKRYSMALGHDRNNKELYVKIGDLCDRMVLQDPQYLGLARKIWNDELVVDPAYPPILQRLMDYYADQVKAGSREPELFKQLLRVAEPLANADPKNLRARAYAHIAPLQQWLYGVPFADAAVDKHITALLELSKSSGDPETALYASEAQLKRAANLIGSGLTEQGNALLDQIAARHQAAAAQRPQDASTQLRAYQAFSMLASGDRRADRADAYRRQRQEAIVAAHLAAKPEDSDFDDIQSAYARWMIQQMQPRAEVEKVYRAWYAARPNNYRARNELGAFLGDDPARRQEAMKLLATPITPNPNLKGLAAYTVRGGEREALIIFNSLRFLEAQTATGQHREQLVNSIDSDLLRIAAMGSADYSYLKLKGKLEELRGKWVEAVNTFQRARTLLGGGFDPDLLMNLAQAYQVTRQDGSLQRTLEDVAQRMPDYIPARLLLARVYLRTARPDLAGPQIAKLETLSAGKPDLEKEVSNLKLGLLSFEKRGPDEIKQAIAALPEKTRDERLSKAQLAESANESDEVVRLCNLVLHDDPSDLAAVRVLVAQHVRDGQRDQAAQVVANALKGKPNERELINLRERLAATTPEALRKWQDEDAEQISDPFTRALRKAQLAMARQEWSAADQQLDAADKLKPDDLRWAELRFQWYELQGKFEESLPFVERVARAGLDEAGGLIFRTRLALDRRDVSNALKFSGQLVGQYGQFAVCHTLRGKAQQLAGQYADAITSYSNALARQSNDLQAILSKADCLEALGRFDEEESLIESARRVLPDNANIAELAMNFELNHGDAEKVVNQCEALLKRSPDNLGVYLALGRACESTAAKKYAADPASAQKFLLRAKDVLSDALIKFEGKAGGDQVYGLLASALQSLGDFGAAENLLKQFAARPDQNGKVEPARQLAMLYERAKANKQAEAAWRDAWTRSGNGVEVELELVHFLAANERSEDALSILQTRNASDLRILNRRIEMLLGLGRLDDAKALVKMVLARGDSEMSGQFYRAIIEYRQGEYDAAIRDLTLLRDRDNQSLNIRVWLARALDAVKNSEGAAAELEAAIRLAPHRADLRLMLLEDYMVLAHWDAFDRVIREAEADPQLNKDAAWPQMAARGILRQWLGEIQNRSETPAEGERLFNEAAQYLAQARKLEPNSFDLRGDYLNLLLEFNRNQELLDETNKVLAEGHKEGVVYERQAVAKFRLGDRQGALDAFDKALQSAIDSHDNTRAANVLTTISQVVGADQALKWLQRVPPSADRELVALDLYAAKADFTGRLQAAQALLAHSDLTQDQKLHGLEAEAESYYFLSQPRKAIAIYHEVLKLKPDDYTLLSNVAATLADRLNDPRGAKPYSSRAYDLAERSGGSPPVADTHGWILTLCGGPDLNDGLAILRKVAGEHPEFDTAHYHLAEAYLKTKQPQLALQELQGLMDKFNRAEQNHQPIDGELKSNVQKALSGLRSQASSR